METNYENNKFHRVINHDKQGVFLQGEGVGNFFYIFCVFKIFNTLFPPSPLEEKPLFYHCLSLDGNQKFWSGFPWGRVINRDKQGGCMEITPFFIMVLHSSKTNKYG
jgi:hypothetical protein